MRPLKCEVRSAVSSGTAADRGTKTTEALVWKVAAAGAKRETEWTGAAVIATLCSPVEIKGMSTQDPHEGPDCVAPTPLADVWELPGSREPYGRVQHAANNSSIDRCWFVPMQRTSEPPAPGNAKLAHRHKRNKSLANVRTRF